MDLEAYNELKNLYDDLIKKVEECDKVDNQIYDLEEAGIKGEFEKKMYNNFKEKKKRLYAEKEELNKVYKLKKEKFCKENWLPK